MFKMLFRSGLLLLFYGITVCWCLTDVKLMIPKAVQRGDKAVLRCHYDLEGDQLYSVKWYKGGREFYRYTPRENPPIKQFPINGLQVLESASNDTHLVLNSVTLENSGPYSCEISADAPSFFTAIETAVLQVVEVPRHDPQITGLKMRYRLGDMLKAECVSKESRPAANLTWLVNDEPVAAARIRRHHTRTPDNDALVNSHSALRLSITQDLFPKGRLKIRCVASLHNVYYRSSEKSVELERPKPRRPPPMSGSSTSPAPTLNWEYVLPAERYPQSTLIFTAASSSSASARVANSLVPHALLLAALCVR